MAGTNDAAALDPFAFANSTAVKEHFERAVGVFGELNVFSKTTVDAMVDCMTRAGQGMELINSQVMNYSKAQFEEGVAAARRMAGAKSVQEVIELQSDYAKSSMDTYLGEMNKFTETYANTMKDAFKPLNERMTAAVELMQAQR